MKLSRYTPSGLLQGRLAKTKQNNTGEVFWSGSRQTWSRHRTSAGRVSRHQGGLPLWSYGSVS
jgi:hypothetical protein